MPKGGNGFTRSPEGQRAQPWYKSKEWRCESKAFLERNMCCLYCAKQQRRTKATVVNHWPPHKGDKRKFWDKRTWEPACKPCHDSICQKQDKTGERVRITGLDGYPIDWDDE
jgi:5-methylcytosine-specific restriction enzyme A